MSKNIFKKILMNKIKNLKNFFFMEKFSPKNIFYKRKLFYVKTNTNLD